MKNKILNAFRKSNKLLVFLFILLTFSIFSISTWFIYGYCFYDGEKEIQNIIDNIIEDNDTNLTMSIKIAEWEKDNIYNTFGTNEEVFLTKPFMDRPPYLKFFALFPLSPLRHPNNPSWIIFTKYGACQENAILFIKMAEVSGLNARLVKFPAEDHGIAEVEIKNNLWIPFDATIRKENISSPDPYYYEKYWWGNVSRVYYLDSNGNENDVTKNYTETGELIIKIVNATGSPDDYKINIISTYKGLPAIKGHLNNNFTFQQELGDNNYKILIKKDTWWGLGISEYKETVTLMPNQTLDIEIKPVLFYINWISVIFSLSIILVFAIIPYHILKNKI